MNLLLLDSRDYIGADLVRIEGRRHQHLREVIKAEPGKLCKAGLLNGAIGTAEVLELSSQYTVLRTKLEMPAPPPLPVTLIVALPRPLTLRKVLHASVSMGVKEIWFIGGRKVEKSYWSSSVLKSEELEENCRLALEQSGDTIMPRLEFRRQFKPFVEDDLPQIRADRPVYVGHPTATEQVPQGISSSVVLIVGPEGGFTDYEIGLLESNGVIPIALGHRALRTEVAVPALLAILTTHCI